jgi:DNA uptake protein ComE-like DNA-binding protein
VPTEEASPTEVASAAFETVTSADCSLFNLNTVTGDELLSTLPNFSDRMVREFDEYRPYVSIQQFQREIGKYVDEAQVAEWQAFVYVPVDPNNSDAATLRQLPGVDEAAATALVEGRPYADTQAFLDALGTLLSAEEAAGANCYLAESAA